MEVEVGSEKLEVDLGSWLWKLKWQVGSSSWKLKSEVDVGC